MFEITRTRKLIKKINKKVLNNDTAIPEKEDIAILIKLVKEIKEDLEKSSVSFHNLGKLKSHCRGIYNALSRTTAWKEVPFLKNPSVHAITILELTDKIKNNPIKALLDNTFVERKDIKAEKNLTKEQISELDKGVKDLKGHILDYLKYLNDSLTAVISKIEEIEVKTDQIAA